MIDNKPKASKPVDDESYDGLDHFKGKQDIQHAFVAIRRHLVMGYGVWYTEAHVKKKASDERSSSESDSDVVLTKEQLEARKDEIVNMEGPDYTDKFQGQRKRRWDFISTAMNAHYSFPKNQRKMTKQMI